MGTSKGSGGGRGVGGGGVICNGLASLPGKSASLLVASCCRNQEDL